MVGVGELGGDEYLFTGNTRRLDSNTDLGLVPIFVSGVNMTVTWRRRVWSVWSVARRGGGACACVYAYRS
jgi:hypothetical protein